MYAACGLYPGRVTESLVERWKHSHGRIRLLEFHRTNHRGPAGPVVIKSALDNLTEQVVS